MKDVFSFRLSKESIVALENTAKTLDLPKPAVVEQALIAFALYQKPKQAKEMPITTEKGYLEKILNCKQANNDLFTASEVLEKALNFKEEKQEGTTMQEETVLFENVEMTKDAMRKLLLKRYQETGELTLTPMLSGTCLFCGKSAGEAWFCDNCGKSHGIV